MPDLDPRTPSMLAEVTPVFSARSAEPVYMATPPADEVPIEQPVPPQPSDD